MVGIEYIIRKAQELGKPVSICIGLGTNLGAHDNQTPFEQYIDRVSTLPGFSVCTAAGNEVNARQPLHGKPSKVLTVPHQVDLRVGGQCGGISI